MCIYGWKQHLLLVFVFTLASATAEASNFNQEKFKAFQREVLGYSLYSTSDSPQWQRLSKATGKLDQAGKEISTYLESSEADDHTAIEFLQTVQEVYDLHNRIKQSVKARDLTARSIELYDGQAGLLAAKLNRLAVQAKAAAADRQARAEAPIESRRREEALFLESRFREIRERHRTGVSRQTTLAVDTHKADADFLAKSTHVKTFQERTDLLAKLSANQRAGIAEIGRNASRLSDEIVKNEQQLRAYTQKCLLPGPLARAGNCADAKKILISQRDKVTEARKRVSDEVERLVGLAKVECGSGVDLLNVCGQESANSIRQRRKFLEHLLGLRGLEEASQRANLLLLRLEVAEKNGGLSAQAFARGINQSTDKLMDKLAALESERSDTQRILAGLDSEIQLAHRESGPHHDEMHRLLGVASKARLAAQQNEEELKKDIPELVELANKLVRLDPKARQYVGNGVLQEAGEVYIKRGELRKNPMALGDSAFSVTGR